MNLTDDKTGLLTSFLGNLPGEMACRLARAVEMDRLMDGSVLPHETILAGLRPVLRSEPAHRTPTPLRLFCRPFEDMLSSAPRKTKQKASIARTSIVPVWGWISKSICADAVAAYAKDLKPLLLAQKMDEAQARARAFWALAGSAMEQALGDDAGVKAARAVFGNDDVVGDAREMAMLLKAGEAVERIQAVLPRPVPQLNEDLLWALREIYDGLVQTQADVAPFVAVIAMNRLAKPWEALRLPLQICRQTQDTLLSQTDMGLVGEIIFTRMDNLKNSIMGTRHPHFVAETLLADVQHFAELSSAIVKEIEVRRDGEWGQRLLKERAAIGAVMDGFMDRAPREFAAALPMNKGSGPKNADFSRPVEPEKLAMGMAYAKLVKGSRNFAAAASFAAKQKAMFEELCNYLRRYNEDAVKALRGGTEERAVAEAQLAYCAELTAMLFSEEEAELLKRRGRAAQVAA